MSEDRVVIIDNGTSSIKAGFSEDEQPKIEIPSVIGTPKDTSSKNIYIGDVAISTPLVNIRRPINRGVIQNWDDIEKIYDEIFQKLQVDQSEYPIFLTQPINNPKPNREKMMNIMFEKYNVPSYYVANGAAIDMFASGRTTGLSFSSGEGCTQIAPIYEGYSIPEGMTRFNFAGQDMTEALKLLLQQKGIAASSYKELLPIKEIKEKYCYVPLDFEAEKQKDVKKQTVNCHNQSIEIDEEQFTCGEILFQPYIGNLEYDGIDEYIIESIFKCSDEMWKDFVGNVCITGGNTLFKGIGERLEKQISNNEKVRPNWKVKVVAESNRKYGTFEGSSILAALATFPQMTVTRDLYDDAGPGIVHRHNFI